MTPDIATKVKIQLPEGMTPEQVQKLLAKRKRVNTRQRTNYRKPEVRERRRKYQREYNNWHDLKWQAKALQSEPEPGYRRIDEWGYAWIKVCSRVVKEHIFIWAKANGRFPEKGAQIHHKNGIRDDNNHPENLYCVPPGGYHERHTVEKILQERIRELEAKVKSLKERPTPT